MDPGSGLLNQLHPVAAPVQSAATGWFPFREGARPGSVEPELGAPPVPTGPGVPYSEGNTKRGWEPCNDWTVGVVKSEAGAKDTAAPSAPEVLRETGAIPEG